MLDDPAGRCSASDTVSEKPLPLDKADPAAALSPESPAAEGRANISAKRYAARPSVS